MRLAANAVKWLAGKGGEAKAKVAHRDYGRLPGHEGDDRKEFLWPTGIKFIFEVFRTN